jgi:hypothetical protein
LGAAAFPPINLSAGPSRADSTNRVSPSSQQYSAMASPFYVGSGAGTASVWAQLWPVLALVGAGLLAWKFLGR